MKTLARRVLAATSISYIVVILDTSIVNVALERIAHGLSTDIAGLQWVVNAYTLAFASLLLSGGTLGDRWGARNVYLAGLAVFTLASALCGIAPSLAILTVARVLQGVGAAMLVPCSLTLLNHAYPDPGERTHAIGVWAGCGGAALAAGPLVGGFLIDLFGWRSIFLANIPIGALGIWMTSRIPRDDEKANHTHHLDLSGQITAILALGTLVAVLIEGPALGWDSPAVLIGIAICIVAWLAFLTIEARRAQPMLPLSFFRNGVFAGSTIVAMATTLTFFGLIFVFSLYFQQVREYSPLRTGLAFLPLTAVVTGGNMVSGRWAKARGPRWPVLVGLGCLVIGFLGMVPSTPASPYWLVGLPMLAIGLGGGLITPAATAALMGTVEKSRAGIAAGVLNSARQTGAALGVAIFGTLIATLHPFEVGMRTALQTAAALSFLSALVWWHATPSRQ
ncbi:DHA2 family efflux MFS transporter permease subunit [Dyella sp. M7H15-1]|uniref:MFS transporter n=1 Tax=Dyella sp. M7H15-1 TaxID=2501295 RepID=UPI001004FEEA|nr:MFS transporter [Dyella sp. M7H15-1]QAU23215.1 DHA2 family efflux MFS transporter permease subunit [Dyella sp. M7H15-1]